MLAGKQAFSAASKFVIFHRERANAHTHTCHFATHGAVVGGWVEKGCRQSGHKYFVGEIFLSPTIFELILWILMSQMVRFVARLSGVFFLPIKIYT